MSTTHTYSTYKSKLKEAEKKAEQSKKDFLKDIAFVKRYKKEGVLKHICRNELIAEGTFMDRLLYKIKIPRITAESLERDLHKNEYPTHRRGFLAGGKSAKDLYNYSGETKGFPVLATIVDIAKPLLISTGVGMLRKGLLRSVGSLFFKKKRRKGLFGLLKRR